MQIKNLNLEEVLNRLIKIDANNNVELINESTMHVANQPFGYCRLGEDGKMLAAELGEIVIENRTSDPVNPLIGRIWLRTDL